MSYLRKTKRHWCSCVHQFTQKPRGCHLIVRRPNCTLRLPTPTSQTYSQLCVHDAELKPIRPATSLRRASFHTVIREDRRVREHTH